MLTLAMAICEIQGITNTNTNTGKGAIIVIITTLLYCQLMSLLYSFAQVSDLMVYEQT